MKFWFPKPTAATFLKRLDRHMCGFFFGFRRSRHEPLVYYRPLPRNGYYAVVEFEVKEASDEVVRVKTRISLLALEVSRVAEELFDIPWESPHLVKHTVLSSEPIFVCPETVKRPVKDFSLQSGLWGRLKDSWRRWSFLTGVGYAITLFLNPYMHPEYLLLADSDGRIAEPYDFDIRYTLACHMILGEREEGAALLDRYMMVVPEEFRQAHWARWRKRYREYVYTPRYPV